MTGTTPSDFAKRLDKTADDTEALLGRLLVDDEGLGWDQAWQITGFLWNKELLVASA